MAQRTAMMIDHSEAQHIDAGVITSSFTGTMARNSSGWSLTENTGAPRYKHEHIHSREIRRNKREYKLTYAC